MVSRIPNDIFQFSTLSALGAGLNVSGPPAAHLTGYGSHGIGTFAEPNPGDMVFLDAVPYLLTAEGVARRAPPDALLPFVMVTKFSPEYSAAVPAGSGLTKEDLMKVFASAGPDAGARTRSSLSASLAGSRASCCRKRKGL
ncbi:hypothetical protein H2203_000285 [Taxawa tesnikishii (nom. ined.)]|nr:hypothetical protein H2203_000285 [Dothideales sp. JES 119]